MYRFSTGIVARLLLVAFCAPALVAQMSVRRVQVLGSKDKDAVEIEVEASDRIVPQTRVLTGPDRLVIDFPNAIPGTQLRSQSVERGQVKDLRVGLFESKPPVTRIVVDLKAAQSYQVFPYGRTVIIKVTSGAPDASAGVEDFPDQPKRPGLVAANFTAGSEAIHADAPPKPALEVSYRSGLLAIKANRATLSEVLNAIQQRTGAEVSIAPGADQEKVVVDIAPAPAPEVLARLLHGSRFNFLILSAANNPGQLERVILTPRTEGGAMPLEQMQAPMLSPMQSNDAQAMDDEAEPGRAPIQPGIPPQRAEAGPRPNPPEIVPPGGDDPQD
jgi:hypothetical protein